MKGIINKIKDFTLGLINTDDDQENSKNTDNQTLKLNYDYTYRLYFEIIDISPNIYLAHRGARICVGLGPIEGSLREKAKHVSKVLARQHESIMEHTNVIGLFHIPYNEISSRLTEYTEFLSTLKYLNYVPKNVDKEVMILIGGSIRGYIHSIRESDRNNYFTKKLMINFVTSTIEKEFLVNLINDGLIDPDECNYLTNAVDEDDIDDSEDKELTEIYEPEEIKGDRVDYVYCTPMQILFHSELMKFFNISDLYKVSVITFVIHDVSRACTAQLTRHRCGISHESQRYVTKKYDKDYFIDPIKLNYDEIYNKDKYKKPIEKMDKQDIFYNYNYLIENDVVKEDARYWLPMGVTTQVMMTFTIENLGKFFKLRLDNHAQKEIRLVAQEMTKHMKLTDREIEIFLNITNTYNCNRQENEEFIVDEEINEEDIESFNIDTEEDAKELLEKSDKYNKME